VMPSRSDSSYSLTARTSHSFTHLRVRRAWLQIILLLGFIQMVLGVLIVTLSLLVTTTVAPQNSLRSSCPIWAGFPVSVDGVGRRLTGKSQLQLLFPEVTKGLWQSASCYPKKSLKSHGKRLNITPKVTKRVQERASSYLKGSLKGHGRGPDLTTRGH
uniref:Family with sequence similarity 189 member B n=1 Tax=Anolis carolinensis TaxID=28377 RepID=A0A803SPY6_ANOCA